MTPDPVRPLQTPNAASSNRDVTTSALPTYCKVEDLSTDAQDRAEHLWRCYRDDVHGYVARRGLSGDADDILSEVFAVCVRRVESIPVGYELPRLLDVASNFMRSTWRKAQLEARLHKELERAVFSSGPGLPPSVDRVVAVSALGKLRKTELDLLILVAWEGLGIQELAVALHCTPGTARVRLHRARKSLERLVDDNDRPKKLLHRLSDRKVTP